MSDLTLPELWALSAVAWGLDVCIDPDAKTDPPDLVVTLQRLVVAHPALVAIEQPKHSLSMQLTKLRGRPVKVFTMSTTIHVSATVAGRDVLICTGFHLGAGPLDQAGLLTARRAWALARLDEQLNRAELAWARSGVQEPGLTPGERQIMAMAMFLSDVERAIKRPNALPPGQPHPKSWWVGSTAFLKCDAGEVIPLALMLAREGVQGVRAGALARWAQQVGLVGWQALLDSTDERFAEAEAVVAQWRRL